MSGVALLNWAALQPAPVAPVPWDPPEARARLLGPLGDDDRARPPDMSRWPRLDRYSRALAVAVNQALPRQRPRQLDDTGLYVASERSCLETNAAFDQGLITKGPRLASPKLFPYTLPGSGASEVALHQGLGGPYLVFSGGPVTALTALLAAVDALAEGDTEALVVAAADVLGPHTLRTKAALGGLPGVAAPPLAEGAAAVTLGTIGHQAPGPRLELDGVLGPPAPGAPQWQALVEAALERAQVRPQQITQTLDVSRGAREDSAAATAALDAALDTTLGPLRQPTLRLVWRTGDVGAALGLMGILAAVEEAVDSGAATLVLGAEEAGSAVIVVA